MMLLLLLLLCQTQSTEAQDLKRNIPPPTLENDIVKEIADLKLYLQEEMLNLRGEIQDVLRGSQSSLSSQISDLVREVRLYKEDVTHQDHVMEQLKSDVTSALTEASKVSRIVEAAQSEVRLISQHKITWQNHTYSNGSVTYPADFLVDGVYRLSCDEGKFNPIQHTSHKTGSNMMVSIDLGARFKIHSVKIWNRICCCQDRAVGILVYADDDLIGAITDEQHLYNILASEDVYGRTIVLKQPRVAIINLLEVQVFGSGPHYEED